MSAFESAWNVLKFMEPHDPEAEKEAAIQRIMESIRFFTSPIDPETRKGGGMSLMEAIEMTKRYHGGGPAILQEALRRLGM
tara:strand:- start:916 stop:1158 length:243 start_codon:yes stop_codon:yes gene_type:complete